MRKPSASGLQDFYSREGRYPADELDGYERSWTASRIEGLRNSAVQLVAAYADTVASHVEKDVLRRELKGHFWTFLGYWLISAIIFAAAVVAGVVVLNRMGVDALGLLRDLARA